MELRHKKSEKEELVTDIVYLLKQKEAYSKSNAIEFEKIQLAYKDSAHGNYNTRGKKTLAQEQVVHTDPPVYYNNSFSEITIEEEVPENFRATMLNYEVGKAYKLNHRCNP